MIGAVTAIERVRFIRSDAVRIVLGAREDLRKSVLIFFKKRFHTIP
jgi:hypothetical protein